MNDSKDEKPEINSGNNPVNEYESENYVSVQEYTGEGFTLRNANPKTGEIAEDNRDEVVASVESFFLTNYKTEVDVKNIVSAVDGVSVFVESVGEPHFYTFAIVPVDVKSKEVKTDEVWSQEGQVESAINSGLYVMAYPDEFANLDALLEGIAEEHPVVGMNLEVAENTQGNGYNTSYYFPKVIFESMYKKYLEKPKITKEELRSYLDKKNFDPVDKSWITIRFYMEESGVEPDDEVYDEIFAEIEAVKGVPPGEYTLILNDNYMDRIRANGEKDNTLNKTKSEGINKK